MTQKNRLDDLFSALGDATRRSIVERLLEGELPLSALAEPYDMSQTAVSRHVNVLQEANIVTIEKRGRTRFASLNPKAMAPAAEWLETYSAFWTNQLASLGQHLNDRKTPQ